MSTTVAMAEVTLPVVRDFSYDAYLTTDPPPDAIDFLDAAYFTPDEEGRRRKLPEPSELPEAILSGGTGFQIFQDLGFFVKFGQKHSVSIEEVQTMRAIRRAFSHDELPIPEPIAWRKVGIITVIYMSIVPGETLHHAWPTLAEEEKRKISLQLGDMIARLRELRQDPNNEFVGSVSRTRSRDEYFTGDLKGTVYSTVREFNDRVQFHSLYWLPMEKRQFDPYRELLPDDAAIRFTHADLHPTNIMVSRTPGARSVSAILDWGSSGWYPEYWEWVKAFARSWEDDFAMGGWLKMILKTEYMNESMAYGEYYMRLGVP